MKVRGWVLTVAILSLALGGLAATVAARPDRAVSCQDQHQGAGDGAAFEAIPDQLLDRLVLCGGGGDTQSAGDDPASIAASRAASNALKPPDQTVHDPGASTSAHQPSVSTDPSDELPVGATSAP